MMNDHVIDATMSSRWPRKLVSLSIGYCAAMCVHTLTGYFSLRTCSFDADSVPI